MIVWCPSCHEHYEEGSPHWHDSFPLTKIASAFYVTDEMIRDMQTFEQIMRAAERAAGRRKQRQLDELIYGAHLNPCIVLGGQDA